MSVLSHHFFHFPLVVQLMDGRKTCGGRLEFKIRIRDPFGGKQVEEVKEKWVVIDHFELSLKPEVCGLFPPKSEVIAAQLICSVLVNV